MKLKTTILFMVVLVAGCASRRAAAPTPELFVTRNGVPFLYNCPKGWHFEQFPEAKARCVQNAKKANTK